MRCRGGQLVPCRGFGWWRCLRGQRQRSRRPPWRRLEAASSSTRGSGGVVPNGPMAQWPNGPAPPADESVEPPRAARGALGRRRSRARALPRAGSGHAPMRATPSVWLRRVATWHIYIHTWSPPGTEGRSHLQAISRQSPGDLRVSSGLSLVISPDDLQAISGGEGGAGGQEGVVERRARARAN